MSTNVLMPQLGESIVEGTIVRWNKQVGDTVARDEPLFEVSTDKVDAEVPSPAAGVVIELRVAEGETVPIDSIVAVIGQASESARQPDRGQSAPSDAEPSDSSTKAPPTRAAAGHVSPVVRRLAGQHGIDLATVKGSGAGGRITKADVLRAAGEGLVSPERIEPLSAMRRRIAAHMVMSRQTAAHAHTVFDVDFSRVAALRAEADARYREQGAKLTYLPFVARAVIEALEAVPIVNATMRGQDVVYRREANLGIAVALDDGLVVPVIHRAEERSMVELSRSIADVSTRARSGRLAPADVEGGTFTITNPGVFGSILGVPIINSPQVAILCVGAVEQRPVVVDGVVAPRYRAYLTLGFDHRVMDGAVADRFMSLVRQGLENFDASRL